MTRPYEDTKDESDELVREAKANWAAERLDQLVPAMLTRPPHLPPASAATKAVLELWLQDPSTYYDDYHYAREVGGCQVWGGEWVPWERMAPHERNQAALRRRKWIMR